MMCACRVTLQGYEVGYMWQRQCRLVPKHTHSCRPYYGAVRIRCSITPENPFQELLMLNLTCTSHTDYTLPLTPQGLACMVQALQPGCTSAPCTSKLHHSTRAQPLYTPQIIHQPTQQGLLLLARIVTVLLQMAATQFMHTAPKC